MMEDLSRLVGGSKLSFNTLFLGLYPGGKNFWEQQKLDYKYHHNYKVNRDCINDGFFGQSELRKKVCGKLNEYFKKGVYCGDFTSPKGPLREFWAESLRMINTQTILGRGGVT